MLVLFVSSTLFQVSSQFKIKLDLLLSWVMLRRHSKACHPAKLPCAATSPSSAPTVYELAGWFHLGGENP